MNTIVPDTSPVPDHARRVFTVLRTDHPRGAPETGRTRVVAFYRFAFMAHLHAKLLAWFLRYGPTPWGIVATTLELAESMIWEEKA